MGDTRSSAVNSSLTLVSLTLRAFLPLLAAAVLGVGAIRTLAHDSVDLRGLLRCETGAETCLMGIVPGETSADAVIAHLHQHAWVDQFQRRRGMDMDSGLILWTWSGAQPAAINPQVDGRLWYENSLVRYVEIPLQIGIGEFWLALGAPETGRLVRTSGGADGYVSAGFLQTRVLAVASVDCPLAARIFWRQRGVLRVQDERSAAVSRRDGAFQPPVWGECI